MKSFSNRLSLAGLGLVLAALAWLVVVVAASAEPATGWSRQLEPVVLDGAQFDQFLGVDGAELRAYAYDGTVWQPVPLQFDEVDASGTYTVEDGLLDANDELVFMAMDLGRLAGVGQWPDDAESLSHPRYEARVTNPLSPTEQGFVYVYRSATLAPSPIDYVAWQTATDRVVGGRYVLGFDPVSHPGLEVLELNGSGVDALDRTKMRITAKCYLPFPLSPVTLTLTEEDLAQGTTTTPSVDGPVRVGGGDADDSIWAYHSLYQTRVMTDVGNLPPPDPCTAVDILAIRVSADWLDPAATGMAPATYYDANTPAGVAIDGLSDGVTAAPPNAWNQVSGGQGSLVQVVEVDSGGAMLGNYYLDDGTVNNGDTGDGRSFGDAGFGLDDPDGIDTLAFELITYILDPDQPNVGSTYRGYYAQPLTVTVAAQVYGPEERYFIYLPLVRRDGP